MLIHLSIRNYAIAEQLDIDFDAGMTVITGETGAGKSIILGALGLALGDRADRDVVRTGCERADISAEFDISTLTQARQWIAENELRSSDDPALCLLRRSVSADGRSRAWINDTPVTLQALAALGDLLMDIHSQHEHHSLLKKSTHQMLLDDFGAYQDEVASLRNLAEQWKQAHRTLSELRTQASDQTAQHELARYQLDELEELALGAGELELLDKELDQLSNAETRLVSLRALIQLCRDDDEGNITQSLQYALGLLRQGGTDKQMPGINELLNTALIQVEEAADELNRQLDQIEINPVRLEKVNARLATIHQLARKHKVRPEDLDELRNTLARQLSDVEHNSEQIARLSAEEMRLQQAWLEVARQISQRRKKASAALSKAVNEQLKALGMAEARLHVDLNAADDDTPQPYGLEQAEFLISTNPGQPAKPLSRIASGGELSRISLAIQVITAMTSDTPCLVFDEVDVGIGGAVARTVGKLLRQLGGRSQVLCVTHQALVASLANHHLLVSKQSLNNRSQTQIRALGESDRLQEIARMLGGEADGSGLSAESLAHAKELATSA
jgi:DNA repair protein RecN (Recombination protein N)